MDNNNQTPNFEPNQPQRPPMPDTHMAKAVIATALGAILILEGLGIFCLPLGIVSLVKASDVTDLYKNGLYAEADATSRSASKWANWAFVVGGIIVGLNILAAIATAILSFAGILAPFMLLALLGID